MSHQDRFVDGNIIRLSAAFTSSDALTAVDPSSIFLAISEIGGVSSIDPTSVTKVSTGNYYYDYTVTTPAEYPYRWTGAGVATARQYGTFWVNSPAF